MADLSNEFENRVGTWLFRPATSVTRPSALYFALFNNATDIEAGIGTEVSGGSYARVDVTSTFGAPSNGTIVNESAIIFPNPTGDWGTIRFVAIMDASTGGSAVTILKGITPVDVNNGDAPPGFVIGAISLTVQ